MVHVYFCRRKYFTCLIFVIEGNRQIFHTENFPIYSMLLQVCYYSTDMAWYSADMVMVYMRPKTLFQCCYKHTLILQFNEYVKLKYSLYSGFSIIWTPICVSKHLDVGSHCHIFGSRGKKTFQSLQFCYRRKQSCCRNDFSRMLQRLFNPVRASITIYNVWAMWAKPWTL